MKMETLAKKPELTKIVLDDESIINEYKEPIEFWTYDRIPLETFTKLATINQANTGEMLNIVKDLILDETGHLIISKDRMLPPTILISAVHKIVATLGN